MPNILALLTAVTCLISAGNLAAEDIAGLQGDPQAIADARAMVETMGGIEIWRQLRSVHFVHEWDFANRPDRYLEHEILDLAAPRSYVTMDSEIFARVRAYSPEYRHWNVTNGAFSYGSDTALANALERAPFSIYRLARIVALDDPAYSVRFGQIGDISILPALEFTGPDGTPRGWILLNSRKEPVLWATTQYVYTFGPLQRFGNLWVPDWATTANGLVRYEMVSLTGSFEAPELSLFAPPPEHRPIQDD